MIVRNIENKGEWDALVDRLAAHPMQSWEWGELKSKTGPWRAYHLSFEEAGQVIGGAQVLVRSLPFPFKQTAYIPRGPFTQGANLAVIVDEAAAWCKNNLNAVSLKIDPAVPELSLSDQWRSSEEILIKKTAVVDLRDKDAEELLASLPHRSARRNIRRAERNGVSVRVGTQDDLDAVLALYHETAEADGFALHEDEFYRQAFDILDKRSDFFVAEQEGEIQAFLWNIVTCDCAFELWGAASDAGKYSLANYLLKYKAMLSAQEKGAKLYDLNGLLNDGISEFKQLFCEEPTYWAGTFDVPLSPLYAVWNAALKARRAMSSRKSRHQDTHAQ